MRFKHLCLAVGGVSVLLTGQASAQGAASCRKAEFKGGSPVFYYDKACMAKLKPAKKATVKKAVTAKTSRKSSPKVRSVQKLLAAKGYKPGVADGVMGSNTRKAIGQYYKKHGLKGSKMNAVLAHLKSRPKGGAAAKRARVAAIKKTVAAKRAAAAKHATATKSKSGGSAKKLSLYQRQQAQAAATSKTLGTAKKLTLYQRQQAQAAKTAGSGASRAQKSANARAARVAAIKKAVAAKRAAAAKTKTAAAKPSFIQRMKNKVKAAVYGKKAKAAGASDAQKAAKARAAKVAAIKKAVAAKRAAAAKNKTSAPTTKTASVAKGDKNVADLQSLLAAKGKYAGKVDGTMNIETRKSVISYYYANKLDVGKGTIAQAVHKDLKSGGAKKTVAAAKVTAKPASAKKASSGPSLYERQQALAAKSKVAGSAPKTVAKKKVVAKAASAAKGDKNIADLQSLLAAKGKYAGKVDGTMNIDTRKSVINYYYANKLNVGKGTIAQAVHKDLKSGGANKTVAAATAPVAKAKPKSSGNKVVDIQTMLAKKGLYSGKSNGLLDSPTRKSILSYYKKHKLKRNGSTIIDTVHAHLSGGTV